MLQNTITLQANSTISTPMMNEFKKNAVKEVEMKRFFWLEIGIERADRCLDLD